MVNEASKPETRQRILQAARNLILSDGVTSLTLDAVSRLAGISKGGLLYHFPSKEALTKGLVSDLILSFEAEMEREAGRDAEEEKPARWLRAYVRATLQAENHDSRVAAGLLAAVATNPQLLAPLRSKYAGWQDRVESDGPDPAMATIIRLAADGLWFTELLGFAVLAEPLRSQVIELLQKLSHQAAQKE